MVFLTVCKHARLSETTLVNRPNTKAREVGNEKMRRGRWNAEIWDKKGVRAREGEIKLRDFFCWIKKNEKMNRVRKEMGGKWGGRPERGAVTSRILMQTDTISRCHSSLYPRKSEAFHPQVSTTAGSNLHDA
ncbi:MAG TPA: hypothetical protein VGO47_02160, partial [Chlamydiales bacterium]|nr:hypothetical protein [Chlamydiales bacterium]